MPDPTNPHPAPPHADVPAKPLWRRVIAAQESGLIVVIALMMAILTIFGGTKQAGFRVDVPAGVSYTQPDDTHLKVAYPSGERTYVSESPFRVREAEGGGSGSGGGTGAGAGAGAGGGAGGGTGGGGATIFGTRTVNKFLDLENLLNVLTVASFYAIMAVGMTAIIILAGIDLSIGSIYAIAAILGASVLASVEASHAGASAILAVPLLLAVCGCAGAACGFVNGFSSVALRVHPFIITLGTMAIYRGAVFVYTRGQTISGLPDSIQKGFFKLEIGVGGGGIYPIPTIITLLVGLAGMFVLSRTVFGRRIFAIGGNEVAARYAGIPVGRVKTLVYTISGALAGLAAAIYVGYFGAAENGAGQGYELNVIAAAVIGGASLSGGRGSALGAILGAILVQLINNGMLILDINQAYNQIVMGLAIIIAVVVDQAKTRLTR